MYGPPRGSGSTRSRAGYPVPGESYTRPPAPEPAQRAPALHLRGHAAVEENRAPTVVAEDPPVQTAFPASRPTESVGVDDRHAADSALVISSPQRAEIPPLPAFHGHAGHAANDQGITNARAPVAQEPASAPAYEAAGSHSSAADSREDASADSSTVTLQCHIYEQLIGYRDTRWKVWDEHKLLREKHTRLVDQEKELRVDYKHLTEVIRHDRGPQQASSECRGLREGVEGGEGYA